MPAGKLLLYPFCIMADNGAKRNVAIFFDVMTVASR